MSRRTFMLSSGLAAAGLALSSSFNTAQASSPILGVMTLLANSTDASEVAGDIRRYIHSLDGDSDTAQEVLRANREMAQNGGFSDLSRSRVYILSMEPAYFFYPAVNVDGFNVCAAFFNRDYNPGSRLVALVEGPSLFGLGSLSRTVAERHGSRTAGRVILPRETRQKSGGTMQRSYHQPDIYRTRAGTVRADYRSHGNGTGTVTVEALNERGTLLAGGDYKLTYHTSE